MQSGRGRKSACDWSYATNNHMTTSILFFCTPEEEAQVWKYLAKVDIEVLLIDPLNSNSVIPADYHILSPWPEPLTLFFHLRSSGRIQWHRQRPELNQKTHNALVNSLLAREMWLKSRARPNRGLLDIEHSPLQIYHRSKFSDGKMGPCELICPPSSPKSISVEYTKWCERSRNWIRNHSTRIHDWEHPSVLLENPYQILSSIYAFPKAREEIESKTGKYIIMLR